MIPFGPHFNSYVFNVTSVPSWGLGPFPGLCWWEQCCSEHERPPPTLLQPPRDVCLWKGQVKRWAQLDKYNQIASRIRWARVCSHHRSLRVPTFPTSLPALGVMVHLNFFATLVGDK